MVKYLIIALLLIPSLAVADTHNAESCSAAHIQVAIDASVDGDTVTVPPGECPWTSHVTISNKGITLQGAGYGEGGTLITMGAYRLYIYVADGNSLTTVTKFKFIKNQNSNGNQEGDIVIHNLDNPVVETMGPLFRITDNYFDYNNYRGYGGVSTADIVYGLIDNNTFNNFYDYGVFVKYSGNDYGREAWSMAQSIGTNRAVYVENNTFNGQTTSPVQLNHAVSGNSSMKYVARYNTLNRSTLVSHAGCTGGFYQPIWQEMYKNIIDAEGGAAMSWFRSASGVSWGNTFPSAPSWANPIKIDNERSTRADCLATITEINKPCNGTQDFDENKEDMTGWRCLGQPGWGPTQTSGTSYGMDLGYVFSGVFVWGNVKGAAQTATNLVLNGTNATQALHLVFGRELFNSANMTIGGAKPETCSFDADVGRDIYVDTTDANKPIIWQCSAKDTWTQHWTPYTCPHPLAGAGTCGTTAGTGGYTLTGGASAPVLVSANVAADGTTLSLVFSRAITATINTGVTVNPSSGAATATYASGSESTTLVYTLSRTVTQGATITVSYTQPGNGLEATDDATDLASFSNVSAINNSTQSNSTYTVTPSAGTGCGISPNVATTVVSGLTAVFYPDATQNYYVSSVGGTCGGSGTATYTTNAVTADCTVEVTCTKISPDITLGSSGAAVTLGSGAVGTLY